MRGSKIYLAITITKSHTEHNCMSYYLYCIDLMPNSGVLVCMVQLWLACVECLVLVSAWMYKPDKTEIIRSRARNGVVEH